MPTEAIRIMTCSDSTGYLSIRLAWNCAPLIMRYTFAAILTVDSDENTEIVRLLYGSGISHRHLRVCPQCGKCTLYLFRQDALERYLEHIDVRTFLEMRGYPISDGVDACLNHLSAQMQSYFNGHIPYPHEIGVFLGYPIEDVRDFIRFHGKGCLHTGYWKVYHNEERAKQIFRSYDNARNLVVCEVAAGKSIQEIASA